jgi:hypothetical protein
MPGEIFQYLARDHERLEGILHEATAGGAKIDLDAYGRFRAGLLKHIAMEEKVLLPAAQERRGGEPLPQARKLRLDHGALAALLVATPTPSIVAAIRAILAAHNPIEEGPGGVYERCEELAGSDAGTILARLQSAREVKLAPYNDGPNVMAAARRALQQAGYDFDL